MTISDLRQRRDFLDAVTDRVWRGFWSEHGYPLDSIAALTRKSLGLEPLPFCLVAHTDDAFLGTVSVILSDEEARPDYTPWIAALWVDPQARRRGIGAALVEEAVLRTTSLGIPRVYLATRLPRRAFYENRGWIVREENVGDDNLTILTHEG